MKKILLLSCLIIAVSGLLHGCRKKPQLQTIPSKEKTSKEELWVPIPLELPKQMFVGHAQFGDIPNLEPDPHKPRDFFLAPEDVKNLALNKPVTSSEPDPIVGKLEQIVDGEKEGYDGNVVELGPGKQWVTIDLEREYELYAIVFWHWHKIAFWVYYDIAVQASNDPEFVTDVTTLFNNDIDNSLGLGVGQDMHYIEKAEGKLVDAKGTKVRYVRLWSQANSQNDYNHYIEVEIWGNPAE